MFSRVFSALAQALLLSAAARRLSHGDFGILASTIAAAAVVVVCSDLGTGPILTRASAQQDAGLADRLLTICRASAIASGLLWALISFLIPVGLSQKIAVALFALYVYSERLYEGNAAVLVGAGRTRRSATRLVLRRSLMVLAAIAIYLGGETSLLGVTVFTASASALASLLDLRRPVKAQSVRNTWASYRRDLTAPGAAFTNSIGTHFRQLDAPIVTSILGAVTAAPYAAVGRLVNPVRLVSAALGTSILANASRDPNKNFTKVLSAVVAVNLLLGVIIASLAGPIVIAVFGPSYAAAAAILAITAPGFAAAGISSVYTSLLQARKREVAVGIGAAVFGVLTLTLAGLLALLSGTRGAAVAVSVMYTANAIVLHLMYRRTSRGEHRVSQP